MSTARPALVLDLFVGFPSYGGNGGISSEVPDIREWWAETLFKIKSDPRIGRVITETIADTPITMVRNRFVRRAKESGCHLLMMIDSDQNPNLWKQNGGKPFWDVAFDEVYSHYGRGPLVIGAPYCGPPNGGENVYVFYWEAIGSRGGETPIRLEQYPRQIANRMSGVSEVGALPTGLILYDMRAFDLIAPRNLTPDQALDAYHEQKLTRQQLLNTLAGGYFRYEWKDCNADEKASTEDVQNTRDISLAGQLKLGYNPVRCAWDCWIGHWKPYCVGKPDTFGVKQISASFRQIVEDNIDTEEKFVELDSTEFLKAHGIDPKSIVDFQAEASPEPKQESPPRQLMPEEIVRAAHKTPDAHVQALIELVMYKWNRIEPKRGVRFLEAGAWTGETGARIIKTGFLQNYTAIDNFEGCEDDHLGVVAGKVGSKIIKKEFIENIEKAVCSLLPEFTRPSTSLLCDSIENACVLESTFLEPGSFDIIFIDANHSFESTYRHIQFLMPFLAVEGYICGHDYGTEQFPGVANAVEGYFKDHFRTLHYDANGGIWVHQKTQSGLNCGNYPEFCKPPLKF